MPYRQILVQADSTEASGGRCATAARLAARFDAHLTGVFLRPSFPVYAYASGPYGGMAPTLAPNLIAEFDKAVDEAAEASRMSFEAAAGAAGAASDWLTASGDTPAAMLDCMRRSDLTVVPRDHGDRFGELNTSPARLGLAAGGPILVVPDELPDARLGRRVLVAWNGSRESARALHDAWPFINEADEVSVLVVSPDGVGGPEGMLQRYLERHGCKSEVVVDRSDEAFAGRVVLDQIRRMGADLVVMGLYGHTRLRELVLGGVSRELLHASPVPLLVSH